MPAERTIVKLFVRHYTSQKPKCDGDLTLQWFWDNAYLPSRTWGPR